MSVFYSPVLMRSLIFFIYELLRHDVITRASFYNKVNFLVVSLNDVIFCKNSE